MHKYKGYCLVFLCWKFELNPLYTFSDRATFRVVCQEPFYPISCFHETHCIIASPILLVQVCVNFRSWCMLDAFKRDCAFFGMSLTRKKINTSSFIWSVFISHYSEIQDKTVHFTQTYVAFSYPWVSPKCPIFTDTFLRNIQIRKEVFTFVISGWIMNLFEYFTNSDILGGRCGSVFQNRCSNTKISVRLHSEK